MPHPPARCSTRGPLHGAGVHEVAVGTTVDAAISRVAQEAVTTARWHPSGASRIDVRATADESVRVQVDDDGSGRTGARGRGGGLGLVGMRERVELLGGRLVAGPHTDGGWAVLATLLTRWARR